MRVPLGCLAGDKLVCLSDGDVVVQRGLRNKHKMNDMLNIVRLIHIKHTISSGFGVCDHFVMCFIMKHFSLLVNKDSYLEKEWTLVLRLGTRGPEPVRQSFCLSSGDVIA